MKHNHHGFTIVELLIVIVVIGILTAISVVAYVNIQERAKTARIQSDFKSISKAVDLYKVQGEAAPECPTPNPRDGCSMSDMIPIFSPYMSSLPTKTRDGAADILYIAIDSSTEKRWAVRFRKENAAPGVNWCKLGDNMLESWWSSAPEC